MHYFKQLFHKRITLNATIIIVLKMWTVAAHSGQINSTNISKNVPDTEELLQNGAESYLPDCDNVTIEKDVPMYFINSALAKTSIYKLFTIKRYDDQMDKKCFPLSPQLLQCKLAKFEPHRYAIINDTLFVDEHRFASLGDFFIDINGDANACETSFSVSNNQDRCHYMTLNHTEFEIFQNDTLSITSAQTLIEKTFYKLYEDLTATVCYPLSVQFLSCKPSLIQDLQSSEFVLQQDFQLFVKHKQQVYTLGNYQLYKAYTDNTTTAKICDLSVIKHYLYPNLRVVLFCISLLALLLTLCCQIMIPIWTCHEKCICSYIINSMIYFIVLIRIQLSITNIDSQTSCYCWFSVHYISSMMAFFWLTTASFDVWKYLDKSGYFTDNDNCRFLKYTIFVWTMCGTLYCAMNIAEEFQFVKNITDMHPGIWLRCWFEDEISAWMFYYGILVALTTLNLMFIFGTIHSIYSISKQTQKMTIRQQKMPIIKIGLKLFVINGIAWVGKALMWYIEYHAYHQYYLEGEIIEKGIICLQGVAIFVVYICRKDINVLLSERIKSFKLCIATKMSVIRCRILNTQDAITLYI